MDAIQKLLKGEIMNKKDKSEQAKALFEEMKADIEAAKSEMTPLVEEFQSLLKKMEAVAQKHKAPVWLEFAQVDFPYIPESWNKRRDMLEDLDGAEEFCDEIPTPRMPYGYKLSDSWFEIWETSSLYC